MSRLIVTPAYVPAAAGSALASTSVSSETEPPPVAIADVVLARADPHADQLPGLEALVDEAAELASRWHA